MSKPKWVRGKALQIVIGLKEIRVGDEIIIGRCGKDRYHNIPGDTQFYRKVLRVIETQLSGVYPYAFDISKYSARSDDRLGCFCSIKAWRRPT